MTIIKVLINFLALHWLDVLLVLMFLIGLLGLWKKGHKVTVIRVIRSLVTKAEQTYGSKTGPIKKNEVYAKLPWIVRLLFTQAELEKLIDDAAAWLKDQLEKAEANLLTYTEEKQLEALDDIMDMEVDLDTSSEDKATPP